MTACMVFFYAFERTEKKKWLVAFYIAMGFGVLTKGLVAIILPFGILFWYTILTKRPRLFLKLFYLPGILAFLIVTVPWFYLVCQANHRFSFISSLFVSISCVLQLKCTIDSSLGGSSFHL